MLCKLGLSLSDLVSMQDRPGQPLEGARGTGLYLLGGLGEGSAPLDTVRTFGFWISDVNTSGI